MVSPFPARQACRAGALGTCYAPLLRHSIDIDKCSLVKQLSNIRHYDKINNFVTKFLSIPSRSFGQYRRCLRQIIRKIRHFPRLAAFVVFTKSFPNEIGFERQNRLQTGQICAIVATHVEREETTVCLPENMTA